MTYALATALWVALLAAALVLQAVGVATGRGMLTDRVRWARGAFVGRLVLVPAWAWLTWHWFVEDAVAPALHGDWISDVLVVVVAAALVVLDHRRRLAREEDDCGCG